MKQYLKNITMLCFLCFYTMSYITAQSLKYGLDFSSFEVVQEKRTGLDLTSAKPFSFSNGFSLSFEVSFQSNYIHSYGYVFRIIGQNEQHVDLLLNEANLVVAHMGKTITNFSFEENGLEYDSYFPFEIQFDVRNNVLNISLKGKRVTAKNVSIKDFKNVNIIFGKCSYPRFQASDIPKMSVKDIRINSNKDLPVYFWPLSKHAQNGVYDEFKKQFAKADNPQWILDDHAKWKNRVSFGTKNYPQIYYDVDENSVSVFDRNTFYSYNINSRLLIKDDNMNNRLYGNYYTNQTVYNSQVHSYYSYYEVGDLLVAGKDFSGEDKALINKERETAFYLHHNKFISPYDSCLYIFGGYGHHKYNNVISKYDFATDSWETQNFDRDRIQPRYLSGLGVIDDTKFLLFGGYGSETGAQELSPQNYYDLYIIDIKEKTVRKIWELESPKDNFVVSNSIVVDTLNNCFYALCFPQQLYNTTLRLGKFSLEKPEYEFFKNNIPFAYLDIYSYVDLFLDNDAGELVAITSSPVVAESTSTVSIYSLIYPPLAENVLFQSEDNGINEHRTAIIVIFSLLLCICGGFLYFIKKKKKSIQAIADRSILSLEKKNELDPENIPITEKIGSAEPEKTLVDKKAILLFGGFQVIDKEGRDITSEFSPLLKQLFLIILLNTLKDGKGVSSLKLRETLWFDKSPESARNNRGVLLSRLRQIFEQVGSINIENRNSYWIVEIGDDVYCDYDEVVSLMKKMKGQILTNENVRKLLSVISGGEMLHNFQFDWIDSFKADFSNSLIDILLEIIKSPNISLSPQDSIIVADAIFIHDFLNEDALKLKCSALIRMGKNGLAKGVYNSFAKEYQTSFGSTFKYAFDQIVS